MDRHSSDTCILRCTRLLTVIRLFLLAALTVNAPMTYADPRVITSGPTACKSVALTFDLCPVSGGRGFDEGLVDTLIEHKIPATFFMSGDWIKQHDAEVRRLMAVPFFEIGTHGMAHAQLPTLDTAAQQKEIEGPVRLLSEKYGLETILFRPPYGKYDSRTVAVVHASGQRFILWDRVSGDPDPALPRDRIVAELLSRPRNGNIIIMHANGKGKHTRGIVQDLHEQLLQARGFKAVTVSQLLDECGPTAP
jgi:peptidoglycan/xylan/chitin deacetylase (PgdA/CDA1 family)